MEAPQPEVIVLMPAYQEEGRIAATVTAARALPGVSRVLVIDDGSSDATALQAELAGAEVLRQPQNGGKGAAHRAGMQACPGVPEDIFLLLDADLGATAAEAAALLPPVLADEVDLTIARFPKIAGKAGFGLVKGLARCGTWLLTGMRLEAPISGQRACRRWVLEAAPIADGYGVEVAMNVAAGDVGARVREVPVPMTHNVTGRNLRGFKHRGRQFVHIFGALLAAVFGRTGEPLVGKINPLRCVVWLSAVAALLICPSPTRWSAPLLLMALLGPVCGAVGSGLLRARKRNYRSRFIPALGGLFFLPSALFLLCSASPALSSLFTFDQHWLKRELPVWSIVFLLGWMALGLVDDLKGDAERKGFRGHISALLHGKLTTGGIKVLGGGLLAILAALAITLIYQRPWVTMPLAIVLIALSANALNLFDLRPGRALKVFWLVAIPLMYWLCTHGHGPFFTLAISLLLLATFVYAPLEFAGMMMLGDTGSNMLGAFLGLLLALSLPLSGQVVVVALLIGLHLYTERVSLTRTIERVGWLRWLDRWGRSDLPQEAVRRDENPKALVAP